MPEDNKSKNPQDIARENWANFEKHIAVVQEDCKKIGVSVFITPNGHTPCTNGASITPSLKKR